MDTRQLREDRHAISQQMVALLDKLNTPAGLARFKELDAKQDALRAQIEGTERANSIKSEIEQLHNVHRTPIGTEDSDPDFRSEKRSSAQYRADFKSFILGASEKRAALSVSADGVLVPTGFEKQLEIVMKAYGKMRQYCTVITTETGNSLPYPVMDDTANSGSWLAEAAAMNQTSPTFSNVTLGASLLSSDQVLVSVQAMQDFAFNPEAFLTEAFGVRLGRGTNKAYTIGDGTNTYGGITGLLNALVTAGGRSVRLVGGNSNSGASGDTNLNSIGTDDFDNLIAALDPAYRDGASFMANTATFDHIRALKDKYGRPIWQTSLSVGVPDSICGYPYFPNQDMPLIGAGNNPIIFGNFKKYLVRDVLGVTAVRFNELYMATHQIGFAAFLRTYGQLLQAKAFVYGNTSAS